MIKKIIPVLIICFSVGFIASCSSSDPLASEAESNIRSENYEAALPAAEKMIQQNPQNPLGYFYKGVASGQKAEDQETPEQARMLYEQMNEAFNEARQLAENMENPPEQLDRIDAVRTTLWRSEHNTGIDYAGNDSLKQVTENPLDISISHLNNALVIQPNDTLSLKILAQVNGMKENYGDAAQAQQKYLDQQSNPDAEAYSLLAQYYRLNDQSQEAINVLEEAQQQYPENTQIVEVLADSYTQNGQPGKAIAAVEMLVEQDPSNPRYHLSLGTQLYQQALNIQSDFDENVDSIYDLQQESSTESQQEITALKSENEELKQEINAFTDRAINQINIALEDQPDNPNGYNTLGIIYQNKAAILLDQRNLTTDNAMANELDAQAKEFLRNAMTNYEKAAELDPNDQSYWRSLFQIYTALGMDEKAAEAEAKAGLQ